MLLTQEATMAETVISSKATLQTYSMTRGFRAITDSIPES